MSDADPGTGGARPPRPIELAAPGGLLGPSWAWLLPAVALVLVAVFGWQAWRGQGLTLTVRAEEGHGIRVGDVLRYRGITAGEVREVRLAPDAREVLLSVALEPGAGDLARTGSRFWIVRPHVSLDEVTGLETLIGARYLTVLPGPPDGPLQTEFVALPEPPVSASIEPGGLEIRLHSDRRHGLRRGAPISYRGVEIGSVLSVELASDATAVELRAYVLPAYAGLVRADSRFWEVSGVDVSLGLTGGLSVQLESARALLVGGIALATPTIPGEPAASGRLFRLHDAPEKDWLEWRPPIPIGHEPGDADRALPRPLLAVRTFQSGRFLGRSRELRGHVLAVDAVLVGPADLLAPEEPGSQRRPALLVAGQRVEPLPAVLARSAGAVRVGLALADAEPSPAPLVRHLGEPEPCLLVADPLARPLALDPARLEARAGEWQLERTLNLGAAWHGAAVIARADGAWIGVLLIEGRRGRIVPVP